MASTLDVVESEIGLRVRQLVGLLLEILHAEVQEVVIVRADPVVELAAQVLANRRPVLRHVDRHVHGLACVGHGAVDYARLLVPERCAG